LVQNQERHWTQPGSPAFSTLFYVSRALRDIFLPLLFLLKLFLFIPLNSSPATSHPPVRRSHQRRSPPAMNPSDVNPLLFEVRRGSSRLVSAPVDFVWPGYTSPTKSGQRSGKSLASRLTSQSCGHHFQCCFLPPENNWPRAADR